MLKINDEIIGSVEKLAFGAEGIIRDKDSNFVVFVKNAVVDDILKVKITTLNKKFARGEIVEIITPSKNRIKPICPIYNACGSCQAQNCDYDFLIEQKEIILKDIFKNIIEEKNILPFIKSPKTTEYRHKIQFPARETKNSKRVLLGYFKNNSHELTNVKFCPMQPEIINKITQFTRDNWHLGCYSEKTGKGLLKNVLFRINSALDSVLLILVLNSNESNIEIEEFFKKISKEFPIIKGCFVNFNPKNTNTILGSCTKKILGDDYIVENLGDKKYKITATSFFQVNPEVATILFDKIKEKIEPNSTILDAYGGVGAIGIYLKEKASSITLVEENESATAIAKENFELNGIENFEIFSGDAKIHLQNFAKENKTFDYVILDPPRSGCVADGLKTISKMAKNIIYVSCNPQTLRRDVSLLMEDGYKLESIQGADFFPWTYHIEALAVLKKK